MLRIRRETVADIDAIRRLNELAFEGPAEARIVDRLRVSARPFISLVAEDEGRIVGHVCFSPVDVVHPDGHAVTVGGLGPMAVAPDRQRQGIGTKLVERGLDECRRAGFTVVVVVGHPEYYPRFGFQPAAPRGVVSQYDVPEPVFMLVELERDAAAGLRGVAHYHEAFAEVS